MIRDYREVQKRIQGIVEGETDLIANLSNIASILKELRGFFWVGFYLVKDDTLVVGPFQGPPACTRIAKGKGVCGSAWLQKRTLVVEDVHEFPGHIACSPFSRSEIVVPVFDRHGEVCMVLDVDSDRRGDFDENDRSELEKIASVITKLFHLS